MLVSIGLALCGVVVGGLLLVTEFESGDAKLVTWRAARQCCSVTLGVASGSLLPPRWCVRVCLLSARRGACHLCVCACVACVEAPLSAARLVVICVRL